VTGRHLVILSLFTIGILVVCITAASAIPVLDNANGGVWKEYIHIPLSSPTTCDAQYKIVIQGSNVSVYNSTGFLKTSGTCTSFWSYVSRTGSDIRVSNLTSELYFWIGDWNYTAKTAVIWVNLTAGSTELDIFYGNPLASPSKYNNGTKTFLFFDDFNTLSANWVVIGSVGLSVNNSILTVTAPGTATHNYVYYSGFEVSSGVLYFKADITVPSSTTYCISGIGIGQNSLAYAITGTTGATYSSGYIARTLYAGSATEIHTTITGWHVFSIVFTGAETKHYIDGSEIADITTNVPPPPYDLILDEGGYAGTQYIDWIFVTSLADPAMFSTPVQLPIGKPLTGAILINATYNAYDITGHLLVNNSSALLIPIFTYVPSTASDTGYLGTGSIPVPGLANITIYLDNNYTLNSVVCNGTAVTPEYRGTTVVNGITFNVYNFTSPSAGLLVVNANVTPVTASGDVPEIYIGNTPYFNLSASISLYGVNVTYGATVKVAVETPLSIASVIYNGSTLTIPASTTEQINGKNYSVYSFTMYNSSVMLVTAKAQNLLYSTTQVYVDGDTNFTYCCVGEPVKLQSSIPCNITLQGTEYVNSTSAEYIPMIPGHVIGVFELYNPSSLQFGYKTIAIPVVWAHVNVHIYPEIPSSVAAYSITYTRVCSLDRMYSGYDRITIYYRGMKVASRVFYLNHENNGLNLTFTLNATNVSGRCYSMLLVSGTPFNVTDLMPNISYGKFSVRHSGEVIIHFYNNSPVTVTVNGSSYSYYPPYLYIYGSGNTTITSYYRVKFSAMSAIGIPMNITVDVNGKKVGVFGFRNLILPVNRYYIHFPEGIFGFQLINSSLTDYPVNLTNSTAIPTAVYKVPTRISLNAYKINTQSFVWFPFPIPIPFLPGGNSVSKPKETSNPNGTIVQVEGTVYNWYGTPVPNATVVLQITSTRTGYTITKVLNTSSSGTFSENFTAVPGVNYSIKAEYPGSTVYIGSKEEVVVSSTSVPTTPAERGYTSTVIYAVMATLLCCSAVAVAYAVHKRSIARSMSRVERGKYFRRVK